MPKAIPAYLAFLSIWCMLDAIYAASTNKHTDIPFMLSVFLAIFTGITLAIHTLGRPK